MLTVVVATADGLPPLKGSFGVLLLSMAAVHERSVVAEYGWLLLGLPALRVVTVRCSGSSQLSLPLGGLRLWVSCIPVYIACLSHAILSLRSHRTTRSAGRPSSMRTKDKQQANTITHQGQAQGNRFRVHCKLYPIPLYPIAFFLGRNLLMGTICNYGYNL